MLQNVNLPITSCFHRIIIVILVLPCVVCDDMRITDTKELLKSSLAHTWSCILLVARRGMIGNPYPTYEQILIILYHPDDMIRPGQGIPPDKSLTQ